MLDPISLFVSTLGTAASEALVSEGLRLLTRLIGLQEAQLQLLREVDIKVDALVAGPFNAGTRNLKSALAHGRDASDRERLLLEARSNFVLALSQDPEPLRKSLAALHLAAVWLALGSRGDVRESLDEAHLLALRAVSAEANRSVSGLKGLRLRFDESARQSRHETAVAMIIPYANELARARRSWGAGAAEAPIFVGAFAGVNEEEMLQAYLALKVSFNQMEEIRRRVLPSESDGPAATSWEIPSWVADRQLYDEVLAQVLRREIIPVIALEDWLRGAPG